MSLPVIVIGFGGHGQVVAAALRAAGENVLAATDLDPTRILSQSCNLEIITDEELLKRYAPEEVRLISGIGSIWPTEPSSARVLSIEKFKALGYQFTGVRHPFTWIAPSAEIADTSQIHAGAVVQPGAVIGSFSIINSRASIDHDCCLEALCHIGPGVTLSGNVKVGAGSHLGTGSTVVQGVTLGKHCFVAAGATVVRDVAAGEYVRGVPAVAFDPSHRRSDRR